MRWFGWLGLLLTVLGMVHQLAGTRPAATATGNPTPLMLTPNGRGGSYLNTTRLSVSNTEAQADGASRRGRISADGAWVAFSSVANNLTDDPQGAPDDIFVRGVNTGETILVSGGLDGAGNGTNLYPRLSANGAVVVWESGASNLVLSDTNGTRDIFWRDMAVGETIRLSVNSEGIEGNNQSRIPDISADGSVVAYESAASNLVVSDTNGVKDVFVVGLTSPPNPPLHYGEGGIPTITPLSVAERGVMGGAVVRVSVSSAGAEANGESFGARLSADGRYVTFTSSATNLVISDTNGVADVFVHDRVTGVTERVSVASNGAEGNRESGGGALSADGRYVVFDSLATNLDPQDSSQYQDVYRHDRVTRITELVSISIIGNANYGAGAGEISADGRYIAFTSLADTLTMGDTNGTFDIFRKDMASGEVIRVSESSENGQGNDESRWVSISADGHHLVFESSATNLVQNDSNGVVDIFGVEVAKTPFPTPTGTATNTPLPTYTPTATATPRIPPYANEILLPLVIREIDREYHAVRAVTRNGDADSLVAQVVSGGEWVLFQSDASNLVWGDLNSVSDIFLWQATTGQITRVSLTETGEESNGSSMNPALSRDGNYLLFSSHGTNLVTNDTNEVADMFLRNLTTGALSRVSMGMGGAEANGNSYKGRVSADGRIVAFSSSATNLTSAPVQPGVPNIYWRNLENNETRLVTQGYDGSAVINESIFMDMTPDGRYVLFASFAPNLIPNDTNGELDVFRYDIVTGIMARVSVAYDEREGNASSFDAEMSADGRFVVFTSTASNLIPTPDSNNIDDVFVRDMVLGNTERVSLTYTGAQIEGQGSGGGDISDDGRYVIWDSGAGFITETDNGYVDTFWRDRTTAEVLLVSQTDEGGLANGDSNYPSLSPDGNYVIYSSVATNIVQGAGDGFHRQIYWWQR